MKKSLLALAVLGAFAGAASAQSSVTIYGSLDMSVAHTNAGTSGNNGMTANTKAWYVQQSNGSRLGFRGNEDIGGGLSAQFQIEHRFSPDTGAVGNGDNRAANPAPSQANASSGSFWQGRSYVQISSAAAGRVYMGRDYTPAFWPAVKSDPFGWDGIGQLGLMQWAGFTTPNYGQGGSNVRTSNTVGYKSPDLGGLTIQVAEGLSESSNNPAQQAGRDLGFNVEYGAGPIYAALGYEKVSGGVQKDGNSLVNLAFHYDLGVVKLITYYARAKVGPSAALQSNKFFSIGALAPVGGGNIKAVIARLDPQGNNNNTNKFAIGYDYYLSKRTNVYADLGLTRTQTLTNNTSYSFGMKHTF